MGDIVSTSSSILTIRFWHYIKNVFFALLLYILKRKHNSLHKRLFSRDPKTFNIYFFSLDVPLMAPAKDVLYCRGSAFCEKNC